MAFELCKECRKLVSSKAKACPHCGAPVRRRSWVVRGLLFTFVVVAALAYLGSQVEPTSAIVPTCDSSDAENVVRGAIEDAVDSRVTNHRLLALREQAELSYDEEKMERQCKGMAILNSGDRRINYRLYKLDAADSTYFVEVTYRTKP